MKISKLFDYSIPMVSAATVLSLGIIVVALIGAYTTRDIKLARDVVEVTGSAKEAVVADTARWIINLETKTGQFNQQSGFDRLEEATKRVTTYLTEQGFTEYETPAMTSWTNYTYPQNSEPIFTGYTISRQIFVRSDDVERISQLANNIQPFTGTNYNVTTQSLELTYSKLNEMRVKLLSEAVRDAHDRADAIAKESGRSVGMLRTASGGVVQVLPQGGIEISDYGSYDTQSLNKDIMVTVRATFEL
jgi:uncharacterized protein